MCGGGRIREAGSALLSIVFDMLLLFKVGMFSILDFDFDFFFQRQKEKKVESSERKGNS